MKLKKIEVFSKDELETIRKVLRSYIVQIDSLNQANIVLRTENIEVKKQLRQSERERESAESKKVHWMFRQDTSRRAEAVRHLTR